MYLQGIKKAIAPRPVSGNPSALSELDPVLQGIFSTRGIKKTDELERSLSKLPSPWLLSGMQLMVDELLSAIRNQKAICIVADFDADGATSCALAMQGLALLGAKTLRFCGAESF